MLLLLLSLLSLLLLLLIIVVVVFVAVAIIAVAAVKCDSLSLRLGRGLGNTFFERMALAMSSEDQSSARQHVMARLSEAAFSMDLVAGDGDADFSDGEVELETEELLDVSMCVIQLSGLSTSRKFSHASWTQPPFSAAVAVVPNDVWRDSYLKRVNYATSQMIHLLQRWADHKSQQLFQLMHWTKGNILRLYDACQAAVGRRSHGS